jgi:DNA-binding ferritin-like protein
MKNKHAESDADAEMVVRMLSALTIIKIHHWKTRSYAVHKATDELYSKLNEKIDSFIEVLLGQTPNSRRIDLTHISSLPITDFTSLEPLRRYMESFKTYLFSLKLSPDLLTIRDEIVGHITPTGKKNETKCSYDLYIL